MKSPWPVHRGRKTHERCWCHVGRARAGGQKVHRGRGRREGSHKNSRKGIGGRKTCSPHACPCQEMLRGGTEFVPQSKEVTRCVNHLAAARNSRTTDGYLRKKNVLAPPTLQPQEKGQYRKPPKGLRIFRIGKMQSRLGTPGPAPPPTPQPLPMAHHRWILVGGTGLNPCDGKEFANETKSNFVDYLKGAGKKWGEKRITNQMKAIRNMCF